MSSHCFDFSLRNPAHVWTTIFELYIQILQLSLNLSVSEMAMAVRVKMQMLSLLSYVPLRNVVSGMNSEGIVLSGTEQRSGTKQSDESEPLKITAPLLFFFFNFLSLNAALFAPQLRTRFIHPFEISPRVTISISLSLRRRMQRSAVRSRGRTTTIRQRRRSSTAWRLRSGRFTEL